jgi:hypothetical protein
MSLNVSGLAGVPTGATAVVLNLTAIDPTNQTHLSVYPGPTQPTISDLNPGADTVVANMVVATLSSTGQIIIFNFSGTTDYAVDVAGYYTQPAT